MRPYLALIKDSFRAAIASSVLYVLLGVITLLLLVLAPLHVRESLDWRLNFGGNVTKVDKLVQRLIERGENAEKYPTIARVWDRLEDSLQTELAEMAAEKAANEDKPEDPRAANSTFMKHRRIEGKLEDALNDILKERDFYDADAWGKKRLNSEARDLIDEGVEELPDERMRRLNRLLMASAFGGTGTIKRGGGNALNVWYGPWQFEGLSFAISYKEFASMTLQLVTYIFDKFVLSLGLLIAILVTANFIPETFLPGSLNLLMSKPISRWGLLLAKFAGGCAFVSLCAIYLFVGLWLWLGIQMGIWDRGILWAIPLYIVVFAIYYSVSTFVGVYSRSPILSIVVTGIFWAACFCVGLTYQMFDGRINNSRTRGLVAVKDKVLHIGELSSVSKWNDSERQWEKAVEIKMMEEHRVVMGAALFLPGAGDDDDLDLIRPVYDPKLDQVLSGVINLGNPATIKHQDLFVADANSLKFKEIGKLPRDAVKAVSDTDGVIVFTGDGKFWRYIGQPIDDESEKKEGQDSGLGKLAGTLFNASKNQKNKKVELFKQIGPDNRIDNINYRSVTFNPVNRRIYTLKDDELTKFDLVDGKYERGDQVGFEAKGAIIESAGEYVVAALATGMIHVFDAGSLKTIGEYKPQNKSPYQNLYASPDGKYFAMRCRNGTLWKLNTERLNSIKLADAISKANISWQGQITAAGFDDQNRLWYSTRYNRTKLIDLDSSTNLKSYSPPTSWIDKAYEYCVYPMYWMFPKPGEFYKLVTHLAASPDEQDKETDIDLRNVSDATDPWQPLWSGLLFMFAMLFITGLIFQFRDF